MFGLAGQISFKKFLSAGLAAGGFVREAQGGCGKKWAADEPLLLNGGDKPMIGFTTDIGASGSGAFHCGNQMRIARLVHAQAPEETAACRGKIRNDLSAVRKTVHENRRAGAGR